MEAIEPLIKKIKEEVQNLENKILYLETRNKLLQDSAYKDLELSRMKEERDEARRLLYQGFSISDKEKSRCDKWIDEHRAKHDGKYSNCYHYIFTPTGVGLRERYSAAIAKRNMNLAILIITNRKAENMQNVKKEASA